MGSVLLKPRTSVAARTVLMIQKIRIGIADDCEQLRMAITRILNGEHDFEVTLQACSGLQLLEELSNNRPDIILMDFRMPEMNGIEASENLRKKFPDVHIIAYSQYDFESNIVEMYVRGVKSFIGKNDPLEELFKAIRIVYLGGVYMTERSMEIVKRHLSKVRLPMTPDLNVFEKSLLRSICDGLSSVEIGRLFNKSHRTIEEHRGNLYKKFNVKAKEELIAVAVRANLI